MKQKLILICVLLIGIGTASAIYTILSLPDMPENLTYTITLSDGTVASKVSDIPYFTSDNFELTGLVNYIQSQNENMNVLYYKVIVPEDAGVEWNLSQSFMERKPTILLRPCMYCAPPMLITVSSGEVGWTYVCCVVQKGDLLFTANGSDANGLNLTLAGTLTNNYGQNWKSRVYNSTSSSWGNVNVGISYAPDVYNRRAKLHSDGVVVGYAMESINITDGIPRLIKIYKI